MKVGLFAPLVSPFATPELVAALGKGADERGFHSFWVGEHVVLFDEYASVYPYAKDGKIPAAPTNGMLDPFATLAFLAGVTQRIRLGTGVCLVPQRNPLYTAKEAATIDWLSGGRFDFGVGVGWLREEFEALGVPFERRGARCREYVRLIRTLWTEERPSFEGELYRLPACRQDPKPVQRPHPPIYFGGESDAALGRVADLGQGWHGFRVSPEGAVERIRVLRGLLDQRGRKLEDVDVAVCPYLRTIDADALARYRDAGVTQITVVAVALEPDAVAPVLDHLAATVLERARAL